MSFSNRVSKPDPAHPILVVLLLLLGVGLWLLVQPGATLEASAGIAVIALLLAFLPIVNRWIENLYARLSRPDPRTIAVMTVVISLAAAGQFYLMARWQGRELFPKFHDEYSYLIEAQIMAHGRLWMPRHPIGVFFESPYIMPDGPYASTCFPGIAILNSPAVWLHLPTWLIPLLTAGVCVGMLYRVVAELVDGVAGLLAALMLMSLPAMGKLSIMVLAQTPALLLGLLAIWSWLRWRRAGRKWPWALLIGVFSGWAAITRPVDAICVVAPLGAAMIWDLIALKSNQISAQKQIPSPGTPGEGQGEGLRMSSARSPHPNPLPAYRERGKAEKEWQNWAATGIALIIGAMPFLAIQIALNVHLTGSAFKTPFTYYNERDYPGLVWGAQQYDPSRRPQSIILQKQMLYDHTFVPALKKAAGESRLEAWMNERLPATLLITTPLPILVIFVPMGFYALARNRRWAVGAALPLFFILYAYYPLFWDYYALPVAPAVVLSILLGVNVLESAWPVTAGRVRSAGVLAIIGACVYALLQMASLNAGNYLATPSIADANVKIPQIVHPPAVVLFRFHPGNITDEEPVYNIDVPWPDDAPVIRAHDLGEPMNRKIYEYYARYQPSRMFYLFDRADDSIVPLGTAAQLAQHPPGH